MSKKVLGILEAERLVFSIPPYAHELLLFTSERVIVARKSRRLLRYSAAGAHTDAGGALADLLRTMNVENILGSDRHNFALSNSEITKVELKKCGRIDAASTYPRGATASDLEKPRGWVDLEIVTSKRKYKWSGLSIPEKNDAEFKDYENILRPVFGDKLSTRFAMEMREALY